MRRNEEFMPMRRDRGSDLSPWSQGGGFGTSSFGASPWQMMRRMQEDMDRIFGQFFGDQGGFGGALAPFGQQTGMQQWAPSVDISQDDKEWRVEVDLPGVRREDIHSEIQDHHLIVRAEMRQEEQPKGGQQGGQAQGQQGQQSQQGQQRQYAHRERRYGYFQRVLPLPENVDEENVRCEFRDGVLTVHLPKMQQIPPRGRRIPVGEGSTQSQTLAGAKGGEASTQSAEASPQTGGGASGQGKKGKNPS